VVLAIYIAVMANKLVKMQKSLGELRQNSDKPQNLKD
jgi:hypothetical protein